MMLIMAMIVYDGSHTDDNDDDKLKNILIKKILYRTFKILIIIKSIFIFGYILYP